MLVKYLHVCDHKLLRMSCNLKRHLPIIFDCWIIDNRQQVVDYCWRPAMFESMQP